MPSLAHMIRPLLLTTLTVALAAALPAAYDSVLPKARASLKIEVADVPSSEGHVLVALYDDEKVWTKPEGAAATAKVAARAGTVTVDFPNLAPGVYGIALLHDADDSGDMTTNFLGIPKEAYGFGNDARGTMSAPDFGESTVRVAGETVTRVRVK